MYRYEITNKTIPNLWAYDQKLRSLIPEFDGLVVEDGRVYAILTVPKNDNLIGRIESIQPPLPTALDQVNLIIDNAANFGQKLKKEFAAENVLMGITQAGMTDRVLDIMAPTITALESGSLYSAITRAKSVREDQKDPVFITNIRLLKFVNKIEDYLGMTRSTSL